METPSTHPVAQDAKMLLAHTSKKKEKRWSKQKCKAADSGHHYCQKHPRASCWKRLPTHASRPCLPPQPPPPSPALPAMKVTTEPSVPTPASTLSLAASCARRPMLNFSMCQTRLRRQRGLNPLNYLGKLLIAPVLCYRCYLLTPPPTGNLIFDSKGKSSHSQVDSASPRKQRGSRKMP